MIERETRATEIFMRGSRKCVLSLDTNLLLILPQPLWETLRVFKLITIKITISLPISHSTANTLQADLLVAPPATNNSRNSARKLLPESKKCVQDASRWSSFFTSSLYLDHRMNEQGRHSSRGPPKAPSYLNLASPPPTTFHTNNKRRIQNGRLTKSQHTSVQLCVVEMQALGRCLIGRRVGNTSNTP